MFGSLWTRLRPAALMVTLGLCFLASNPTTGFSQEPAVESVAAQSGAATPPVENPTAEAAAPVVPPTAEEVMGKLSVGIDTIFGMSVRCPGCICGVSIC